MEPAADRDWLAWSTTGGEFTTQLQSEELATFVRSLTQETVQVALGVEPGGGDPRLSPYATRLWKVICLHLHQRKVAPASMPELRQFTQQLQEGAFHSGGTEANVLCDAAVAQGMELLDNRAADRFEREYMPAARNYAERFIGRRGVDLLGNLAADLSLPRGDRPPKIATYRGKTPLTCWLKSVVVNKCISSLREDKWAGVLVEPVADDRAGLAAEAEECEDRLAPAFAEAVQKVAVEERVLLKLLILDGVQQKQLAQRWEIDPGTLTRRKQRAAANLLTGLRQIAGPEGGLSAVRECLELLLAGDSPELRARMAGVLAGEVRSQAREASP